MERSRSRKRLKRAIDGIRTRDTRDHNPVLYQLSYDRHRFGRQRQIEEAAERRCLRGPVEVVGAKADKQGSNSGAGN